MSLHGKRIWIASEAQVERCHQLMALEIDGQIANLRFEVPIDLIVRNKKICTYRCDAIYDVVEPEHGRVLRTVYEEVKGFVTPDYVIKARLFDALMDTKLSVIMIGGDAPVFDAEGRRKRDESGKAMRSRAQWMHNTWAGKIPE